MQGDVIAITDDAGATVARYTYDSNGRLGILAVIAIIGVIAAAVATSLFSGGIAEAFLDVAEEELGEVY